MEESPPEITNRLPGVIPTSPDACLREISSKQLSIGHGIVNAARTSLWLDLNVQRHLAFSPADVSFVPVPVSRNPPHHV